MRHKKRKKTAGNPRQHWVSAVFTKIVLLFFFRQRQNNRRDACGELSVMHHCHARSARWTKGGRHGLVDSKAAHNPTPPTAFAHRGPPSGPDALRLPHVFKNFPFGVEQGVAAERGQRKRCPPPLRPPTPCLIDPMGGPCAEGHTGGEAQGVWGQHAPCRGAP